MPPVFNLSNRSNLMDLSLLSLNVVIFNGFSKKSICNERGKRLKSFSLKDFIFFSPQSCNGISFLIFFLAEESFSAAKLMMELSLCTPSITSHVPSGLVAMNNEGTGIPKKIDSIRVDCLNASHLNCLWYSGAMSISPSFTIDINSFTLIS